VKHSPIEKLPATLRTTLYQLVYFRIYDLNRECRNQIRDLPSSLAIDMNILATAADLESNAIFMFLAQNFTEYREFF
jgi:hypothetical protein